MNYFRLLDDIEAGMNELRLDEDRGVPPFLLDEN